MSTINKRNSDIIKNAAFSFRTEGCSVPASFQKRAKHILSDKYRADTIISKHIKAYSKD